MTETLRKYDLWSATYDDADNPLVAATHWALERVPFECRDADVIELGCGTGRHVTRVLGRGARAYVGIDGSAGMLAIARSRYDDTRVRFVEADLARQLPFEDATFDRALVVLVLEHLDAIDVPLREIARLLRPTGCLRIVDIHPALLARGTSAHFKDRGEEIRFTSVIHSVQAIAAALARANLAAAAVREIVAEEELIERTPKLTKHRGQPVVLDIEARPSMAVDAASER